MTDGPARAFPPWLPWTIAAVLLSAWVARVPLEGIPHVSDEIAYTLQSRLFAAGVRVGPPGDQPSMLAYPFWVSDGASFSPFSPGWPALLALGEAVGLPWLLNPLLAGLFCALLWPLVREWSDARTATLATAIAAFSPAAVILGGSRMAHTSVLVALAALLLVVVRGRDRPWAWWLAGAAAGYVVLARPFDAALLAGPMLAWGLWRRARAPDRRPSELLGLVAPPGLAAALLLADNAALTGDALTFPMQAFYDSWVEPPRPGCERLGFGADVGCAPTFGSWGHSPAKATQNALRNALVLDRLLMGLPGGLAVALFGLLRARRRAPWLLIAAVVAGYALYWSPGKAYGARFWHPMLLVLPYGVAVLATRLQRMALPVVVAIGLTGLARALPDLSDRYWCVDGAFSDLIEREGISSGVVFVDGVGRRPTAWPALGTDAFACDPMLESGDALLHLDPTAQTGGLQIRHAPRDPAQRAAYLAAYHAEATAWLARHDVAADTWVVVPLDPRTGAPPVSPD